MAPDLAWSGNELPSHLRKDKQHAENLCDLVDFETFSKILNRPGGFRDPGEPEEYCRGFQVFDKDMTGFIGVGQLRYILTNLGEKMSDEEVDELLKAVDTSSGEINYTGKYLSSDGLRAIVWLMFVCVPFRSRQNHSCQLSGFHFALHGALEEETTERLLSITFCTFTRLDRKS